MASDYLFEAEKKLRETKEQVADLQSRLAAILALLGADTQFEAEMNLRKLKEDLKRVALIARCGGLAGMPQADALTVIRKITIPYFDTFMSSAQTREALI